MKKSVLFLIFTLTLNSAQAAIEHPMDTMFKTWIGTPIKEVVKAWGNPSDIDYKRGQTVYTWKEESTRFVPGTMYQHKTECERKLIVDISGKVIFGAFDGNGCPFTSDGAKKWNKTTSSK